MKYQIKNNNKRLKTEYQLKDLETQRNINLMISKNK